jgi:hypothetical protein
MHDKNLFQSYTQDSRIADVEDLLTRALVLLSTRTAEHETRYWLHLYFAQIPNTP